MDKKLIKDFHDACYYAKKIVDMIPAPPDGLAHHFLHIITAIHTLGETTENVRIIDVASRINLSRGTVSEYIHELSEKGFVTKRPAPNKRNVYVKLTDKGGRYYADYVEQYHDTLAHIFSGVNTNDMLITIRTIQQAYYLISQERSKQKSAV
jgi:Transcriptional regulators